MEVDLGRGGRADRAVGWGARRALGDFLRTGAPRSEGPLEGGALQAALDSARNGVPLAVVEGRPEVAGAQAAEQEAAVVKIRERDDGG